MGQERFEVTPSELSRWLLVGVLIVVGLGLYFGFAQRTPTVVEPSVVEAQP